MLPPPPSRKKEEIKIFQQFLEPIYQKIINKVKKGGVTLAMRSIIDFIGNRGDT